MNETEELDLRIKLADAISFAIEMTKLSHSTMSSLLNEHMRLLEVSSQINNAEITVFDALPIIVDSIKASHEHLKGFFYKRDLVFLKHEWCIPETMHVDGGGSSDKDES